MTEGELWVRQALADLRATKAVPAFLLASHRRAAQVRRQRPALARQSRTWAAAGAAAWLLPPVRARARTGLTWWALVALMLDWHLGMIETEEGEPRMLGAADACTLLRAWLVPLVASEPHPLVVAAGLASDAADGALARRSVPTRAGRDLESLADSAFGVAALRGAVRAGRLDRRAASLETTRLAAGFAYASAAYFATGRPPAADLARAGRSTAPLRGAGLVLAAAGRRRAGSALLAAGALAGAVQQLRGATRR